jgi:hypothetical protein
LITLLGLSAFLSLNTAQAVPNACPAASRPSFVTSPAFSPYLKYHQNKQSKFKTNQWYLITSWWMTYRT